VLALLATACAPTAPPRPATGAPGSGLAEERHKEPKMSDDGLLELVATLCDTLARAPLAAEELALTLGPIQSQGRSAIYVQPTRPALSKAILLKDRSSGEVDHVELLLATPGAVTLDEVEGRFGAFSTPPRVSAEAPVQAMFHWDPDPATPFACSVFVKLDQAERDPRRGVVRSLAVRRDIRL